MFKIIDRRKQEIKIKNAFLLNPFFAYSAFWAIAIVIYYLSPSKLNTSLNGGLLAFLLVTILLSTVFAMYFNKKFKGKTFFLDYRHSSKLTLLVLWMLYILEFVYCGDIPLLSSVMGTGVTYLEFGIPTLHVVIVIVSVFYCVYNFFMFFHFFRFNNLFAAAASGVYFLLIFSRGLLLFILVVTMLLFIFDKRLKTRHYIYLCVFAVIVAWGFGVLGNIRNGYTWNDSALIMSTAQIDGNRYSLLSPFYWVEEYIISPLRNLNYNVSNSNIGYDFKEFLYCILPDFLAKRLFPSIDYSIMLVVANLTTSTAYIYSYIAYGYFGMFISFMVFCAIVMFFANTKLLYTKYKVICFAILFYLYAMTIFDNMPFYSGYSLTLLVVLVYSLFTPKPKDKAYQLRDHDFLRLNIVSR